MWGGTLVRVVQQIILIVGLILFLVALPGIMGVNETEKSLEWHPGNLITIYGDFFSELADGSLGTYQLGSQRREISEDIADNFVTSLKIMAIGVYVGVIISLIFGIFISRFRLTKGFNACLNILASIPDFIIIVISLILAIKVYKVTWIRLVSFWNR
jgi:peptide/nickel transport system permease protein